MENGQGLPHPDSEPVFEEVTPPAPEVVEEVVDEKVNVTCAGCMTQYTFEIDPRTESFKFECQGCGTKSTWTRT